MPLTVASEKAGTRKGGRPGEVFPVVVKTWYPAASEEYATKVALITTRALRTERKQAKQSWEG